MKVGISAIFVVLGFGLGGFVSGQNTEAGSDSANVGIVQQVINEVFGETPDPSAMSEALERVSSIINEHRTRTRTRTGTGTGTNTHHQHHHHHHSGSGGRYPSASTITIGSKTVVLTRMSHCFGYWAKPASKTHGEAMVTKTSTSWSTVTGAPHESAVFLTVSAIPLVSVTMTSTAVALDASTSTATVAT